MSSLFATFSILLYNKLIRGDFMEENIVLHDEKMVNEIKMKMPDYNIITDLSDFFKIVGDSTRLQILMALEHGELCVFSQSPICPAQAFLRSEYIHFPEAA